MGRGRERKSNGGEVASRKERRGNVAELYAGKDVQEREKRLALERLLVLFQIVPLELETAKLAGRIRFKYQLGINDAIIAASAITTDFSLFTFNLRYFNKVEGLKIFRS